MNKKGFTMIELLAVLALMAIILLVAVPSISNQLRTMKQNNYEQFQSDLFLATESYISAAANDYVVLKQNNGQMCIKIQDLIEGGWIKSSLVDPNQDKTLGELQGSVIAQNKNSVLIYIYDPKSESCRNDYTQGS